MSGPPFLKFFLDFDVFRIFSKFSSKIVEIFIFRARNQKFFEDPRNKNNSKNFDEIFKKVF